MSDAQLIAGFEACVRRLVEERNRPDYIPIHIAIARSEAPGGGLFRQNIFEPLLGHTDYTPRSTVSTLPPDAFAVAFHTPRDRELIHSEHVGALLRQVEEIAGELQALAGRLPTRVRQVLFLPEIQNWWRTLFHLAWHFDRPFLNSSRDRLLASDDHPTMRVDETCVQESGCSDQHDVLPGIIFGTLKHDVLTASEAAVGILLESLRGSSPPGSTKNGSQVLARLHERFRQAGELESTMPGPKTNVKLLRFSNSFLTPPATEWAALELGGVVESFWRLARINADQEFCQIRGPATHSFNELAAEAGNILPSNTPDSATLFVEDRQLPNGFVMQVSAPTPILSPGAVERWLRFVFSTLKRLAPDELQIQWGTLRGASSYGLATLKQNIFAASALAIELAGLAPTDGSGPKKTRGLCFAEFEEPDRYPPPATGRYIRWTRGDRSHSGETEWQPGWTWMERPEDGWVQCGECESGPRRIPLARGRPPAVCDWLPSDWPAAFFPLGSTAEHCGGWRGLVQSILGSEQDTIPPDDPEYGWRTVTRASRHFAHHLGVIPLERLMAPLPASRDEARREVEPLLDGLVVARRTQNTAAQPTAADNPTPRVANADPSNTSALSAGIRAMIEGLLTEACAAYSDASQEFTVVAIPCASDANGVHTQRCDEDSPDWGEMRDGVFYWPLRSFRHLGTASISGIGSFVLMAFETGSTSMDQFFEFSGRAAASLLAASPPWVVTNRPGPGFTAWPAAVMFLSPSAQSHAIIRQTGPRILRTPWASSILALRDILSPPAPQPTPPPVRETPRWEATARRLMFRGQVCKQFKRTAPDQEKLIAAFQEEGWPDAVDDPLPPGKLATTVESLNDRLQHIRFRLNGAGTGICWLPV